VSKGNPGHRLTSARGLEQQVRAHGVSLAAVMPIRASRHTSHPDLGGGADVAQASRVESSTNTTMTEEVSK
jgi:hypothetical protein